MCIIKVFSAVPELRRVSLSTRLSSPSCSAAAVTCTKKKKNIIKLFCISHTHLNHSGCETGALRAQQDCATGFAVTNHREKQQLQLPKGLRLQKCRFIFRESARRKGSAARTATGWQSPSGCSTQPAPLGPAEHPFPSPRMQMPEHLAARTCKDSPQLSKYRNRVSTKLPCSQSFFFTIIIYFNCYFFQC